MRIAFVHVAREHLGLEYLSSLLKKAGHRVALFFDPGVFTAEDNGIFVPRMRIDSNSKIITAIKRFEADIVGFSAYSTNYIWAKNLARKIKQSLGCKIIFGGVHSTMVPEVVMREACIDFIIRGEGEYALLELISCLEEKRDYRNIENLVYRDDSKIIVNKLRPLIQDLDVLPLPDKDLFAPYVDYYSYIILTQRGCKYDCSFCSEEYFKTIYDSSKYARRRGISSVINELSEMKNKYKFKEVIFFDADFLSNALWLCEFLPEYKKRIGLPFKCMARSFGFNETIGRLLKESGCYTINFGIQSWDSVIRKNVLNRAESDDLIEEMLNICEDARLKYDIDIIFGIPHINARNAYLQGLRLMSNKKCINRIKCFQLALFPKCKITAFLSQNRLFTGLNKESIESGEGTDTLHRPTLGSLDAQEKEMMRAYEILPCLPVRLRKYLTLPAVRAFLCFLPSIVVYLFQFLHALQNNDLRYKAYIRSWLRRLLLYVKSCPS